MEIPLQVPIQFQFHKGTIKTHLSFLCVRKRFYFNSIKVRLKHLANLLNAVVQLFQFHKGTIKTDGLLKTKNYDKISIP